MASGNGEASELLLFIVNDGVAKKRNEDSYLV